MVSNIFKVDGCDGMAICCSYHVASQGPLLSVRAELQDLVIYVVSAIIVVIATLDISISTGPNIECDNKINNIITIPPVR